MIYVIGPGHGGPGLVAHSYLEGSYTENYPAIERNRNGHATALPPILLALWHPQPRLARNARLIHEGGELGYSLLTPMARPSTIPI